MPHRLQPPVSFASLATDSPDIVARYDRNLRHLYVNAVILDVTGRPPEDFIGKTNRELGMPAHLCEQWDEVMTAVLKNGTPQALDFSFQTPRGLRYFHSRMIPERDAEGQITSILAMTSDQTDRFLAQDALRNQEATLRSFYESSPICMGIVELAGEDIRHIYDNPAFCRFFGLAPDSTQGQLSSQLGFSEEMTRVWLQYYREALWENKTVQFDYRTDTPDGRWLGVTVAPIETASTQVARCSYIAEDISDRKSAEAAVAELNRELENRVQRRTHQLQAANETILVSLREKELLLKEVHHRVKNNLQIISSLLRMHLSRYTDPRLTAILQESQLRIQSMSMIHEQLYQGGDMSEIPFKNYLELLIPRLSRAYVQDPDDNHSVELHIQNIALPIDVAIPCALIAVELISNAFKYAFRGHSEDHLRIDFSETDNGVQLVIQDNGPGLPDGFNWRHTSSVGFTIVQALIQQIKADLRIDPVAQGGVRFTLSIPIPA